MNPELVQQVQFEIIDSQRKEIEALKNQIQHLESILFSRAVLIGPYTKQMQQDD